MTYDFGGIIWPIPESDWFTEKSPDYPFQASTEADHTPRPKMVDENVYGHFIYQKTSNGAKWGFKTAEARDQFVKVYHGTPA